MLLPHSHPKCSRSNLVTGDSSQTLILRYLIFITLGIYCGRILCLLRFAPPFVEQTIIYQPSTSECEMREPLNNGPPYSGRESPKPDTGHYMCTEAKHAWLHTPPSTPGNTISQQPYPTEQLEEEESGVKHQTTQNNSVRGPTEGKERTDLPRRIAECWFMSPVPNNRCEHRCKRGGAQGPRGLSALPSPCTPAGPSCPHHWSSSPHNCVHITSEVYEPPFPNSYGLPSG